MTLNIGELVSDSQDPFQLKDSNNDPNLMITPRDDDEEVGVEDERMTDGYSYLKLMESVSSMKCGECNEDFVDISSFLNETTHAC